MSTTSETTEIPPSPSSRMGNFVMSRPGNLVDTDPHRLGTLYNVQLQLSNFAVDFRRNASRILSSETHHIPTSSGLFKYGMPDLTYIFMSSTIDPGMGLNVGVVVIIMPFHAIRFIGGHIAPYYPYVRGISYPSFWHNTGVHSHGGDPKHVNVGGTTYIRSYAPSSTASIPSNSFHMSHPPYVSQGPSEHGIPSSHGDSLSAYIVTSGGYIPPYILGVSPLTNPITMFIWHLILKVL